MVDVSGKPVTVRTARAEGRVRMSRDAFDLVRDNALEKGDVLGVARLAGIGGAKQTSTLVPLCHPLTLDHVDVVAELDPSLPGVRVEASIRVTARTGAEMEALTAVAVACLAVYDMAKSVDRSMHIEGIRLLQKTGGTRGEWSAEPPEEER
jgi:cyclic pyranopterin phosphate synthase